MRAFDYHRASSATDACRASAEGPSTAFLAGGTTLLDLVKLDVMRPSRVVDIGRLPLDQVEPEANGTIRIGALVRNSDLAWHEAVRTHHPLISEAILAGASAQIRNMATTAGNLMQRTRCPYFRDNISACNKREPGSGCAAQEGHHRMHAILGTADACIATHPSDLCVALAALEAVVLVAGPDGEREIPFAAFHLVPTEPAREHALEPGELITAVRLPAPWRGARSRYVKIRDRESYEFALCSVAAVVRMDTDNHIVGDVRLALGGVGTKPWRASAAEEVLRSALPSEEVFREAAEAILRDADLRPHNAFKAELVRRVIPRVLADLTRDPSAPLPASSA